jgi:hypothetical protein
VNPLDPVDPLDPLDPLDPVPDPAGPEAAGSVLPVADDVSRVPVGLGDTDWRGDDLVGVVFGLAALGAVVVGACVGLGQPPDGGVVIACSAEALCVGLGFGVVVAGFGVGVVLGLAVPLPVALGLELPLGLALPLELGLVVPLAVLWTGLLDRVAALVFVTDFDGLGEAAGDDGQVEAGVAV